MNPHLDSPRGRRFAAPGLALQVLLDSGSCQGEQLLFRRRYPRGAGPHRPARDHAVRRSRASRARARPRQGLTLLELIVVIAIVAALAGIGVGYLGEYRTDAENAVARENLRVTREAISRHFQQNLKYPDSLDALTGPYLQQPWQTLLLVPMNGRATAVEVEVSNVAGNPNAYTATGTKWVTWPTATPTEFRNIRIKGSPYDAW